MNQERKAYMRYQELVFFSIRFSHMFWLRFLVLILSTFKSNLWLLQNILLNNQKCDPVQSLYIKPKKQTNNQPKQTKIKKTDALWNKSSFFFFIFLSTKTITSMSMICITKRLSNTRLHLYITEIFVQRVNKCNECSGFNNFISL